IRGFAGMTKKKMTAFSRSAKPRMAPMLRDFSVKARPFDYPYHGRLDPARAALLVIDLQVDFLASDGYFARKGYDPAPLRAILPTVNALIATARQAGLLIVHTRQGYRAAMAGLTEYEARRGRRRGLDRNAGRVGCP